MWKVTRTRTTTKTHTVTAIYLLMTVFLDISTSFGSLLWKILTTQNGLLHVNKLVSASLFLRGRVVFHSKDAPGFNLSIPCSGTVRLFPIIHKDLFSWLSWRVAGSFYPVGFVSHPQPIKQRCSNPANNAVEPDRNTNPLRGPLVAESGLTVV